MARAARRQQATIHYRRLEDFTGAFGQLSLEAAVRKAMNYEFDGVRLPITGSGAPGSCLRAPKRGALFNDGIRGVLQRTGAFEASGSRRILHAILRMGARASCQKHGCRGN